jgi:hypothetical protein
VKTLNKFYFIFILSCIVFIRCSHRFPYEDDLYPVAKIIPDDKRNPTLLGSVYNWACENNGYIKLSIDSSDTGMHYNRPTINLNWISQAGKWVGFKIQLNPDSLPEQIYFYVKNVTKTDSMTIKLIDKYGTSAWCKIEPPKNIWVLVELDLPLLTNLIKKEDLKELLVVYEHNFESGSFIIDGLATLMVN